MSTHAVIAVRGGHAAKSRLGERLDAHQREALVAAMLLDMLATLRGVGAIAKIWVVTPTPALAALAARAGASVIADGEAGDLNRAFAQARALIAIQAPDASVLLLPGDLPLMAADDVEAILRPALRGAVVITPADSDGGTGALVLPAHCLITTAFGRHSFASHRAAAAAHGFKIHIVRTPGLGLDIDRPIDLDAMAHHGVAGRTGDLLSSWKTAA